MENMPKDYKYKEIGGRIRDARDRAGMTQAELATKVGYKSGTAISLIESGERRVQISELEIIAKLVGVSVDYLISGKSGEKTPDVAVALRADKDLSDSEVNQVMSFIDLIKRAK